MLIPDLWNDQSFNKPVLLVGGAVRDKLLGKEPKDRDWVIVGATAEDVRHLLDQGYSQVGADFPVFLHPETNEEYALARVERKVGVGYHGFEVTTDASVTIEQDLARRDLTINSMAMDAAGNIIDPYGGKRDLCRRVLRHTTEAFAEDPLRVLRLARFAARYDTFRVAPETIELCKRIAQAGELNNLSVERIWVELEKGFSEKNPVLMFEVMHATGALCHCAVLQRTFGSELNDSQRTALRFAAMIKDVDQRFAVGVIGSAKRFGFNDALRGASKRLVDLYTNLHTLITARRDATGIMNVLKSTGALREGKSFNDFVMLAASEEVISPHPLAFNARELEIAACKAREVRASDFPDLSGKELGSMIEQTRIKNLSLALDIPIVAEAEGH